MYKKILIANRGEIAVRLVRALRERCVRSVGVYASDDAHALHVRLADESVALDRTGPDAYLDIQALIGIARATGCNAVLPGYGFLSERADFADACASAGIEFIGPTGAHLALFGDKARARALAEQCDVPVMPGSSQRVTLEEARVFFEKQRVQGAGMIIKALGGGGGRGMRAVLTPEELPEAYERCVSEARSFGVEGVYVERLMRNARHIEIQIIGDGKSVASLGDRECTLQRRFQKLVEIAPSPSLAPHLKETISRAALRMAKAVGYRSLGTFEFLVDESSSECPFVFIETNPRLQVEHTVTEAVTGLDLVQLQLSIGEGATLASMGVTPDSIAKQSGFAVQWRVNVESLDASGVARPSAGRLDRFEMPSGPGVRVDTHGFAGLVPSPHYDILLAKIIVHHPSARFEDVARRSAAALTECRIEGVATNQQLLRAIAARPEFGTQVLHTRFVEEHLAELLADAAILQGAIRTVLVSGVGTRDPAPGPELADASTVCAPMPSKLIRLDVVVGQVLGAGTQLGVLEAMKMEHLLLAGAAGKVVELLARPGEYVTQGQAILRLELLDGQDIKAVVVAPPDLNEIRGDLRKVHERTAPALDVNRPAAVAKRHAQGGRMARANIADLCESAADPDNFVEYGALAVAAQSSRRTHADLAANTPADGMVAGIGSVNARQFGAERARCVVMAYDYTVLAGTQGMRNHHKKDRMLAIAHQLGLPVVLFAEGGGGRPGDTDWPMVAALNNHTFSQFAALSGKVPVVGIVHGRCFAGNAALLGCCDVIIATRASNIGMSGPAMIEGGGLGTFTPEQIGPSEVQAANGVIDVLVEDEAAAVAVAQKYLAFFQGPLDAWECADPRELRHVVPENRLRVYDVRVAMRGIADAGSLLELRQGFGIGILTALARVEGRAVGIIANNPHHLGGAIDGDAADKAARFMQLCNAHGLPIISLVDTPGFMVGPETEARAQVRHVCRLFVVASHLRVPYFSVVLRKGYGLGAQGMTAGGFDSPVFTVAWPTGEFGAMGLEGAVRLGFRKELSSAPEGRERDELFAQLVAQQYANGEATNMALMLEIDAVIDPADTRKWLMRGLESASRPLPVSPPYVDTW